MTTLLLKTPKLEPKPYMLEFTIDGLPKTTNQFASMHWRARHKLTTTWKRAVWARCWHKRPDTPLIKAQVTLTRSSSQVSDFDGLVSSFKCIIDGLIEAGILVGDRPSHIGQPTYLWQKAPARKGHIKVKVEGI